MAFKDEVFLTRNGLYKCKVHSIQKTKYGTMHSFQWITIPSNTENVVFKLWQIYYENKKLWEKAKRDGIYVPCDFEYDSWVPK